jgi:hypothetical protein
MNKDEMYNMLNDIRHEVHTLENAIKDNIIKDMMKPKQQPSKSFVYACMQFLKGMYNKTPKLKVVTKRKYIYE